MVVEEITRTRDKNWPDEMIAFKGTIEFEVKNAEDEGLEGGRLFIRYGFRKKYGGKRRLVEVFRKPSDVLAEYIGGDQWSANKKVLWPARKLEGRGLIKDLRAMPDEYKSFDTVRFRSHVSGPRVSACWGIAIPEDDVSKLINLGLIRESCKG